MLSTKPTSKYPLLSGIAVLCALLAWLLVPAQSEACSITAGGSCGGTACPDGESCKKVSDYECKCVKDLATFPGCGPGEKPCQIAIDEWMCWPSEATCPDIDDIRGWPDCEDDEKRCQTGPDEWICWPSEDPCPRLDVDTGRDMPDCEPGEKHCQIDLDDWICWPSDDPCPAPGVRTEEVRSAFFFVVSNPPTSEAESRATREVTLSVSGCSGCFNSAYVILPGNVIDVAHMSSDFSGAVNSSGIHWLGDRVWETACFGNSSGRCGSVRRTYLIAY
ncbi:MAG: hypothetical protein GY856_18690 [bacterium]|nr:hypothetical protein [bacterium]